MTTSTTASKLRESVDALFASDPTLEAVLAAPAQQHYGTKGPVKGSKAVGLAFDDDGGVFPSPEAGKLAASVKKLAVEEMQAELGPQSAGLVAARISGSVRVLLYLGGADLETVEGLNPSYRVADPLNYEYLEPVSMARYREILPDGTLGATTRHPIAPRGIFAQEALGPEAAEKPSYTGAYANLSNALFKGLITDNQMEAFLEAHPRFVLRRLNTEQFREAIFSQERDPRSKALMERGA